MGRLGKVLMTIALLSVLALLVVTGFNTNTQEFKGEIDDASCSIVMDRYDAVITYTTYVPNSHIIHREIFKCSENMEVYTVQSYTVEEEQFGTLIMQKTISGLNDDFREYHYIVYTGSGYLVDNIPLTMKNSEPSSKYLGITTLEHYADKGLYTKVMSGSTKTDLAEKGIIELMADGTSNSYEITSENIGDVDLEKYGVKKVIVNYTEGRTDYLTLEVVDFICSADPITPGISFDEAVAKGMIDIVSSGATVTCSDWNSSVGSRYITLVADTGYTCKLYVDFVSSDNTEVASYTMHGFTNYVKKGSELGDFTYDITLRNGTEINGLSSEDSMVTGFNPNRLGTQVISIWYEKYYFNLGLYVYDESQSIPINAKLINGAFNKEYAYSVFYYDDCTGLDLSEYMIKVYMCDGSTYRIPVDRSMITTEDDEWIEPGVKKTINAIVHTHIQGYFYNESVRIVYSPMEENVKQALSFNGMLENHNDAMFTHKSAYGSITNLVIGHDRSGEFYASIVSGDNSQYRGKLITYNHLYGTESVILFVGSVYAPLDLNMSMIGDSKMVSETHDREGIFTLVFEYTVTELYATAFGPLFGVKAGDNLTFTVKYNLNDDLPYYLSSSGDVTFTGTFEYDPDEPVYSKEVQNLIDRKDTVVLTVYYKDGTSKSIDIPRGSDEVSFVCDEGCGLYKDPEGLYEFVVPVTGITVSMYAYYL